MQRLYYRKSSEKWENGLPVGNGRVAGMVWDNGNTDIMTVNHERIWKGRNRNRKCIDGAEYLPLVRKLLKEDKVYEATVAANLFLGGLGGTSGLPHDIDPYQPAGTMRFIHREAKPLQERSLELECGTAWTRRENSTAVFWADCNNKMLCCKWQGILNGDLVWDRREDKFALYTWEVKHGKLFFACHVEEGIDFRVTLEWETDGKCTPLEKGVRIEGATYVNAFVDAEVAQFPEEPREAELKKIDTYYTAHCKTFRELMHRNELELETDAALDALPTDERVAGIREGKEDTGLFRLHFDYGRYLLISSCLHGKSPANLQGKWNDDMYPPCESDYHTNINSQMCYWMTEPLGMRDYSDVLFDYMYELLPSGKEAAKKVYGCRGVWLPLTGDCWPTVTSDGYGWSVWIGAAPWMAQHMWQRYLYTGDKNFLEQVAYPFFKEIAEFYEDYLEADENGIYQIMPSQSPENRFLGTGAIPVSICISAAMDIELAMDALDNAVTSAEILGVDCEQAARWKYLRDNLPPLQVGSDGRILEWDKECRMEAEPGHRHFSHLYGFYPSDLINEYDTPGFYAAAKKTVDYRVANGSGHTGWSRALISCMYGKFGDKDQFLKHLKILLTEFTTDSLLNIDPPFQVDGNLGGAMAVMEALASISGGKVRLLHALPDAWANGKFNNLYLPGGHKISFGWKNGKIERLEVEFGFEDEVCFVLNGAAFVAKKSDQKKVYEF